MGQWRPGYVHALQAWLWFGSEGVIRRKQQEAQNEAARCLTLLTNCVLLWNTVYMQEVLQQLRAEGYPVDETRFRHLSPSRYDDPAKYSFTNPTHLDPLHRPLYHIGPAVGREP